MDWGEEKPRPDKMRRQGSSPGQRCCDRRDRRGGIMRIGRVLTIPAIVTLGMTGSILAATATPAMAAHAVVHVQASGTHATPDVFYHA